MLRKALTTSLPAAAEAAGACVMGVVREEG